MSEHITLAESLKQENAEATTERNAFKAKYKPWQKRAAIIAAVIFVLSSFSAWYKDYTARAKAEPATAPQAQEAPVRPAQDGAMQSGLEQEVRLQLSDKDWSQPVFVSIGRCITWHRTNPNDPPAAVEAKDNNGPWYSWDDYQKLRSIGTVGNPAWFRFKATVPSQGLGYEIRPDGHCS